LNVVGLCKGNKEMFRIRKKFVLAGAFLIVCVLLVACSSSGNKSSNSSTERSFTQSSTTASVASTPQLITPKDTGGSSGKGPLVISSPTTVPGGKPGTQQIVLGDRTLIIYRVTKQNGASSNSTLIRLDLTVQNTSRKSILNLSTFFQLMGPEGDAFGYQYNSSDNFYGPITAHQIRSGTIVFQIPKAATSSLQLLYRPEIAAETVIIRLKIS
jgi:Domain of unknown function (DUF4352)